MGLTVYAENMGFFHKGSGGKGIAPGDVCMTPPPPPAGPIPVPYVNIAQASDLTKGSKTVKIDGEPTALEDVSEISTSSGNEPGSQPPKGVISATNKGKASFTMWSFTVKVEGKGVCRHGDPMFQNEASTPGNGINPSAMTTFRKALGTQADGKKKCPKYKRKKHAPDINAAQDKKVHGKKCWECGKSWAPPKKYTGKYEERPKAAMTPDHQPPMSVAWAAGGCHMKNPSFKEYFASPKRVKPHCRKCSNSQGSRIKKSIKRIKAKM
jgi:uncharacterized Zn-binding protein involved in type VI secretion